MCWTKSKITKSSGFKGTKSARHRLSPTFVELAAVVKVLDDRKSRGDVAALDFRDWDDWIASPYTQVTDSCSGSGDRDALLYHACC